MRIVCISDTHSRHSSLQIPDGDVLCCAGDICRQGTLAEVQNFDVWAARLPHPHKIVIAGNHDWCFQRQPAEARQALRSVHYLQDEAIELGGLKFYGSPWQPKFFNWAFNLPRGPALREKWDLIPEDVDLLLTHGPPYGILDRTDRGFLAGCDELAGRVAALGPKLHIFGHIHEAYGQLTRGATTYVNASCCDIDYRPCQAPIVVDL